MGIVLGVLLVLSLVFCGIGMFTSSESEFTQSGFGRLFKDFPEVSFDSFSLVFSFGDYSVNLNLGFNKPFFSLLADGSSIHLHAVIVLIIIAAMVFSCMIPEISLAMSLAVAVLDGIIFFNLISPLKLAAEKFGSFWLAATEAYWLIAALLCLLLVNGLIGIGGKIFRGFFMGELPKVLLTFFVALLVSNTMAVFLGLFTLVTIGFGWCGGVFLWFVIAVLLVVFCEIMDLITF